MTHSGGDRPDARVDPVAPDQAILEVQRERVLAAADIVIPGHGERSGFEAPDAACQPGR